MINNLIENKNIIDYIKSKVSVEIYNEILSEIKEFHYTFDYKIETSPIGEMRKFYDYDLMKVYIDKSKNTISTPTAR